MPANTKPFRPCLAAALCSCAMLLCACNSADDRAAAEGSNYRTVKAEPLRDTAAAIRANALGLGHLDAGELDQAEQAFKRALEADVKFGPAHNNLGKLYFLKRDFYLAAHEFDDAITLMPKAAEPKNNLGLTLLEAGELDDAAEHFRQAVTLDPATIDYQANLARTLVQRGDRGDEVITLLRAVATRDPRVDWKIWANHELGLMGLD